MAESHKVGKENENFIVKMQDEQPYLATEEDVPAPSGSNEK